VPGYPRFLREVTFVLFGVVAHAQVVEPPTTPTTTRHPSTLWQEALRSSPMLRFLVSLFESTAAAPTPWVPVGSSVHPQQSVGACAVAPLDPIEDPAAQQLEASNGAGVVDIVDMLPAAARAVDRFQSKVVAAGGTIVLRSAYRPAAYQRHLQNVWYKWMRELRDNHDPACQDLRAEVQEEFARHRLIDTQHPVAVSDHTRGIAFDAIVDLPPHAKIGTRRFTLDSLARLAGLLRPAIATDPVHFKYLAGTRSVTVRRHHNA
jgi:hypothetical protein